MHPAPRKLDQEPLSDEDLVGRAADGDRWARGVLYDRHASALAGTVARTLGHHDTALDLVHDAFLYAFEHLGDLREPSRFRGWLFQIALSRTRTWLRRQRIRRAIGFVSSIEDSTLEMLSGPDASPEARAELRAIDGALRRLSVDERLAWALRRVEGCSMGEVASHCGWSLSTAKRRYNSADRRMTAILARGGAER